MIQEPASIQQLEEIVHSVDPINTTRIKIQVPPVPGGFAMDAGKQKDRIKYSDDEFPKNVMFIHNSDKATTLINQFKLEFSEFTKVLCNPLNIQIDRSPKKSTLDKETSKMPYPKNLLPSIDKPKDGMNFKISFTQENYKLLKKYETLLKYIEPQYRALLQTILTRDPLTEGKLINNIVEKQAQLQIQGQDEIYNNDEIVLDNKDRFLILEESYKIDQKEKTQIPLIDVIHNIFQEVEFNVYFPTMVKVTIGGISSMDKINQNADISLRLQVKVNVPGFSDSPSYYKDIFKKMSICFKAEDMSNQFNINVKFDQVYDSDSGISIAFEEDPKQYYKKNYKWSQYKVNSAKIDEKFQNFEGFILVADLNNVKVKLAGDEDRSPFELLDLKGIIEIQQLNVQFEKMKELFPISRKVISDLILKANPKIKMKFNLVQLYSVNDTELTPLLLFNHITSYENIQKDGYTLASSLMLLEMTNSRNSRYELSKNPCHRRWKKQWKDFIEDRYKEIKNFRIFNVSPLNQGQEKDNFLWKLYTFHQEMQRKSNTNIFVQIEKIIRFYKKKEESFTEYKIIIKRIEFLRSIQSYLLQQQVTVRSKQIQDLALGIQMIQHQQILSLQFRKMQLKQELKIAVNNQQQARLLLDSKEKQILEISQYLQTQASISEKTPALREYQHDHQFNNSKVHYHFPIYRHPGVSLFLLFITTNILGILNLFIFFQDPSFGERLASLATLLISFVGMIPVTQGIINSIKITLSQILIYLMMLTPLLCLGYSFYLKVTEADPNPWQNPLFWICVFITILNIFVPLISFLIFKIKEQPYYKRAQTSILKSFEYVNLILPGSKKVNLYKYLNNDQVKKQRQTFPKALTISIINLMIEVFKEKIKDKKTDDKQNTENLKMLEKQNLGNLKKLEKIEMMGQMEKLGKLEKLKKITLKSLWQKKYGKEQTEAGKNTRIQGFNVQKKNIQRKRKNSFG